MNRTPTLMLAGRLALRVITVMVVMFGVVLALPGCAPMQRTPSPEVWASCPPLPPPPKRNDADAQTRRIAALEGWYGACREAALAEKAP
jgi:hypothetical protein